jgi:hypothetical protein
MALIRGNRLLGHGRSTLGPSVPRFAMLFLLDRCCSISGRGSRIVPSKFGGTILRQRPERNRQSQAGRNEACELPTTVERRLSLNSPRHAARHLLHRWRELEIV